jgi:hypothetical protein
VLTFKVDAADPVTTVRRAMEAAKLLPDQMPVQDAPMPVAPIAVVMGTGK